MVVFFHYVRDSYPPVVMQTGRFLLSPQIIRSYSVSCQFNSHLRTLFLHDHFNIIFPSKSVTPKSYFPNRLPKILYAFITF